MAFLTTGNRPTIFWGRCDEFWLWSVLAYWQGFQALAMTSAVSGSCLVFGYGFSLAQMKWFQSVG